VVFSKLLMNLQTSSTGLLTVTLWASSIIVLSLSGGMGQTPAAWHTDEYDTQ
jgi:hypothetical protein